MVTKGSEFLEIETGVVYRAYFISRRGEYVMFATRQGGDGDYVLNTRHRPAEEVLTLLSTKQWVPNTPAARALYVSKTR
jgi:hypothetical protein